jgi:hypothetical protein
VIANKIIGDSGDGFGLGFGEWERKAVDELSYVSVTSLNVVGLSSADRGSFLSFLDLDIKYFFKGKTLAR